MAVGAILGGLATAGYLGGLGKDALSSYWQKGLGDKELAFKEKMMQSQLAASVGVNEANRRAAMEYMAMFRSEKAEGRKDKAEARKMQLIMMMLNGMRGIGEGQANAQAQQEVGPPPPTSMMALLGGR